MDELEGEIAVATAGESREWTLRVVERPRRTVVAPVPAPPLGWTSVVPKVGVRPWKKLRAPFSHGPEELAALTRIVRGKDSGDSYNYAPPAEDELVDTPIAERLDPLEDGPLRRVDVLYRTYEWDGKAVDTETRFEQRIGERFIRIRIDFDNPCDDQRVRVHVPLLELADCSRAEGQFAVVERGLEVEDGYGEVAVPRFPRARSSPPAGSPSYSTT